MWPCHSYLTGLYERTQYFGKIHQTATAGFLEKGFQGASLRNLVRTVGVTTGAFYGYYSSKEALSAALVEPCAAA